VAGTWATPSCAGERVWRFTGGDSGTAVMTDVDCTTTCSRVFEGDYRQVSDSGLEIIFTSAKICGRNAPLNSKGGVNNFSCSGDSMTLGRTGYQRK
jgi:hypothetical protein